MNMLAGQTAAGLRGFSTDASKLKNIDVSDQVERHSGYYTNVAFLGSAQPLEPDPVLD